MGCCGNTQSKKGDQVKKKSSTSNMLTNLKVSPEMFISLKFSNDIGNFYTFHEVLGEGGFGCVHLATYKKTCTNFIRIFKAQKFAIKQLQKKMLVEEDSQFLNSEYEILKTLDHPNIVRLYEAYQDEANYYFVMEYCSGGDLFQNCFATLTEQKVAFIMKQILSAVNYFHQKNIIHRDLKLENILYDGKDFIKIIDFGTSRRVTTTQKLKLRIGTLYYMAPEVMEMDYDLKSDIWSCGVILYLLLCGYPPFNGNESEIKAKIKGALYSFKGEEWNDISDGCKNLLRKMFELNPENRISAEAALKDPWFEGQLSDRPVKKYILMNLEKFYYESKLQSAIKMYIIQYMFDAKDAQLLSLEFKAVDKNNDGTISYEELKQCNKYQRIYQDDEKSSETVDKILKSADCNNSGRIDYTGRGLISGLCLRAEEVIAKIETEKDQNGYLYRQEVAEIMGGLDINDTQWVDILHECDSNSDGRVSIGPITMTRSPLTNSSSCLQQIFENIYSIKYLQFKQNNYYFCFLEPAMPNKQYRTHPRTYGKDSRQCRVCGAKQGLIRKYDMNMCRRCFRDSALLIGFIKYN